MLVYFVATWFGVDKQQPEEFKFFEHQMDRITSRLNIIGLMRENTD
jgi:hypothetical protein